MTPESVASYSRALRVTWFRCLLILLAIVFSASASAQEPRSCLADTGSWEKTSKGWTLQGALCFDDASATCPDFATFTFSPSGEVEVSRASTPLRLRPCTLTAQGGVGRFALYHDGKQLIAVDGQSLKMVWQHPAPTPYEVSYHTPYTVLLNKSKLLILRATKQQPKIILETEVNEPLEVVWQKSRLVLVQASSLRWWPLTPDGIGKEKSTKYLGKSKLRRGRYALDNYGLIRPSGNRAIRYYRFDPPDGGDYSYRSTINETDEVRFVGGWPDRAIALTSEGNLLRVVARTSTARQTLNSKRYEHKYWKLTQDDEGPADNPRTLAAGAGPWLAIDGGRNNQAMILDTREYTWEVFHKALDFEGPSQMVHMDIARLIVAHDSQSQALSIWSVVEGRKLHNLSRADFQKAGLQSFHDLEPLSDDNRHLLIRDPRGAAAILDATTGKLSPIRPVAGGGLAPNHWKIQPQVLVLTEISPASKSAPSRVLAWHLVERDSAFAFQPKGTIVDALSPRERWFGYCIGGASCKLSLPNVKRAPGDDSNILADVTLDSPDQKPVSFPTTVILVSLLLLIIVMLWRLDFRRVPVPIATRQEPSGTPIVPLTLRIEDTEHTFAPNTSEAPAASPATLAFDGSTLALTEGDDTQTLNAPFKLQITRQSDPEQLTRGGLITVTFKPVDDEERTELIEFHIELSDKQRALERLSYRSTALMPRMSWSQFETLREALREHKALDNDPQRALVRKARDDEDPASNPMTNLMWKLRDKHGRRLVTEFDESEYLHRVWTPLPWRLAISIGAALAVAIPVGFAHLVTQDLSISLFFWAALALPVGVITWILISWGLWNRLHLLRFGHAVEGKWRESGTIQQSLSYTLPNGVTYRLRRGQWRRADLVPVVLYDPKRPRFAAQYTAHRSLNIVPSGDPTTDIRGATTTDMPWFPIVIAVLALPIVGGFFAFQQAFPQPLPEWTLQRVESNAEDDEIPMLAPCLGLCQSFSSESKRTECQQQCHHRQLRYVFKDAGKTLPGDPLVMPGQLRDEEVERLESLVSELRNADPSQSCDALAQRVNDEQRWSQSLQNAFQKVYGATASNLESDPLLVEVNQRLETLSTEFFSPLCQPPPTCLDDLEKCVMPPSCAGPMEPLYQNICGLEAAVRPITTTP